MTDPVIAALFAKLPPVDTEWPVAKRVLWLRCMAAALVLVYDPDGDADVDSLLIQAADTARALHPVATPPQEQQT